MKRINRPIRYAALYRVSTKKQMNSNKKNRHGKKRMTQVGTAKEEDLPTQRAKIREVAQENEWVQAVDDQGNAIEYVEGGISAYYTPMSKRDMITKAFEDGKKGKFDILIVYKLDRFGRRREAFEYACKFVDKGIRLYDAVKRSEFKNTNEWDDMKNFIEFFMAKQSSEATKERVTDAMNLMHKLNLFTGGKPPYGYEEHSEYAGMLAINKKEAETVKEIFNLYTNKGMGMGKIASYLNEKEEHLTREGGIFRATSLSLLIRNPIYKGYLAYNKTNSAQGEFGRVQKTKKEEEWDVSDIKIDEYAIISEEVWDRAKQIRLSRIIEKPDEVYEDESTTLPSRKGTGRLLLTGYTFCASCGGTMVAHTNSKVNAKGERYRRYYYKCLNRREGGKSICNAKKVSIEKEKLENGILTEIKQFSKMLMNTDILDNIQKLNEENEVSVEDKLKEVNQKLTKSKNAKRRMLEQINQFFEEDDPDEEYHESLKEALKVRNASIKELEKEKEELVAQKSKGKINNEDFLQMKTIIEDWDELYNQVDLHDKKEMLSKIINKVIVHEEEIEVEINIEWGGLYEALVQSAQGISEISASLDSEGVFNTKSAHQYVIKNNQLETHSQHLTEKMPSVKRTLKFDPDVYEVLTDIQKEVALVYLKAHKTNLTIGEYCEENGQSYKYLNILSKNKSFIKYCEMLISSDPNIYKFPSFKKGKRKKELIKS